VPVPPLALNAWLRYEVVSRLLPSSATSILEIGCGAGAFGARFAAEHDYLGVEPDGTSYATAHQRLADLGRGEVRHGRSEVVVEPGRRFDVVCAFEVLEHLADDEAAVRDWSTYVQPGGHLLISTPAFQERFGRWDVHAGHYRRYSPEQMTELLTRCGLREVEVVVYGFPLGYALEGARNTYLRVREPGSTAPGTVSGHFSDTVTAAPAEMDKRTAGSGRLLQPKDWMAAGTQVASAPFRWVQRRFPTRGTGLVARARLPQSIGGGAEA
jgi:SAM-dependent methyltransferase